MSDIAINPVTRRVQFTGNTGTGPFAFTFNVLNSSDIAVYKNTTLLTLTADYTVTIAANGTGSVTLQSGQAVISSDYVTIIGGRNLERTTDFVTAGDLLASSLNEQLDSNVIMSQQLDESFGRALSVSPGDVDVSMTLPVASSRANQIVAFTSTGAVTTTNLNDLPELTVDKLNVDNLTLDGNTISTTDSNGNLILTPNGTGDVVVSGDLVVNGTTTTIHSTVVDIADKNITIAYGSSDAAAANGAGITVDGADATMNYYSTPDGWEFNKAVTVGYTGGTPQDLGGVLNVYSSSSSVPGMVIKSSGTSVDPKIQFEYSSQIWTVGQDSSSDDFKIINGTNLNSSAEIHINTDGDVALGGVSHYSNYELSVPQRVAIRSGSAVAGIDFAASSELVFDGNVGGTNGSFAKFRFASFEADKMVIDGNTLKVNALAKLSGSEVSISDNLKFGDDKKAVFGDSTDLSIYFDATANKSYISHTGSGDYPVLEFNTDGYDMRFLGDGSFMIRATPSGDVKLYHAGSPKLATTATGIDVTGTVTADGLTVDGTADINGDLEVGAGGTGTKLLQINGSGSSTSVMDLEMRGGGTGNPTTILRHTSSTKDFSLLTGNYGSELTRLSVTEGGDISFYEDTGTTPKFFWDASEEALRIGSYNGGGNPSGSLFVESNANNHAIHIEETGGNSESWQIGVNTDGDLGFYNSTSTTASVTFDDSGNVGIGTSSPSLSASYDKVLHINSTLGSLVKLTDATSGTTASDGTDLLNYGNDTYLVNRDVGNTIFGIGGVEKMRLDSSGNLLVGKPSAGYATDGFEARASGYASVSDSGATPFLVNRNTDDGNLIAFYKAGSPVGSIGVINSNNLTINGNATNHTGLQFGTSIIWPMRDAANADGTVDLGTTTGRFKDLYLSGGVYLGGTGSANKLDDYEEGTFSAEFRGSTGSEGSASTTVSLAQYTKIGRLVTIQLDLRWAVVGSWTGSAQIHGLPFTVGAKGQGTPGIMKRIEVSGKSITALAYSGGTLIKLFNIFSDLATKSEVPVTAFDDNLNEFAMTMTYSV